MNRTPENPRGALRSSVQLPKTDVSNEANANLRNNLRNLEV